jgi:hypothetical protein
VVTAIRLRRPHADSILAQAEDHLGKVLLKKGNVDGAIAHFQKATQSNPAAAGSRANLRRNSRL